MRSGSPEELYCQEPLIFINIKMSVYFPTKALDSQRWVLKAFNLYPVIKVKKIQLQKSTPSLLSGYFTPKIKNVLFLAFGCMNLSLSLFSRCLLIWIFLSKSPKHKHSHLWEGSLCFKWNTKWSSLFRSENQLDVYIVTCVYACMCGHVCSAEPMEVRRPQILELEMTVSWVLGIEPGSPARVVRVLNCWAISHLLFFFIKDTDPVQNHLTILHIYLLKQETIFYKKLPAPCFFSFSSVSWTPFPSTGCFSVTIPYWNFHPGS